MPTTQPKVRISSILLEAGVVTPEQVDAALARQLTTGLKIGETLVELGAATEEDIGWALATQLHLPFVDPRPDTLDRELVRSFPAGVLQRLDAIPLVRDEAGLSVAVSDPLDQEMVRELEQAGRRPLRLSVGTPSAIRRVLREILGASHAGSVETEHAARDRSGPGFLQLQLTNARRAGASEIHFLPRPGSLGVFHRLGSRLLPCGVEPAAALDLLLARLEDLGCPLPVSREGQTHARLVCAVGHESVRVEASLLRGEEGTSVVLTLESIPDRPALLEDLGLDPVELASLRGLLESPAGLGIVTGPPRCGASTTLACLEREAASSERRALSFGEASMSAREALEAAVRQSADLVTFDPLDGEGLREALGAAAAGRFVLVRTDATEIFALLEQLSRAPRERAALADRLRFVVQQRLLPGEPAGQPEARRRWSGRRAVFETLLPGEGLCRLLRRGASAEELRAAAEREGFQSLTARFQALIESGEARAADLPLLVA